MSRQIQAMLLTLAMLFTLLAGCSGSSSGTAAPAPSTAPAASGEPVSGAAPEAQFEDRYRFTAQEAGTSLLVFATVITESLKPYLPANVELDILPTGATIASNTMVNDGQAEVGFGEAGSNWAVQGILLFDKPHTKLRSVAGGFQFVQMQAFMTKEFSEKYGIETFEDLAEKKPPVRLYTKNKGTMGQAASELQLQAYGITYDDIKAWGGSITETGVSDISDAMKDLRADMWLDNLAPGHPTATELVQLADIRILKHTEEGLAKINPNGFYTEIIPGGTWRGNDGDVIQPGSTTMLIVNEDVSEEFVYLLCKAMDEHQDDIRAAHSLLENFDMKIAWQLVNGVQLHPGAERYYKEMGYMQ